MVAVVTLGLPVAGSDTAAESLACRRDKSKAVQVGLCRRREQMARAISGGEAGSGRRSVNHHVLLGLNQDVT